MGPVVGTFIGKVLVGAVVSKVVTKITGNELLGGLAGFGAAGLMGGQGLMTPAADAATAAASEGAALATGSTVVPGGSELFPIEGFSGLEAAGADAVGSAADVVGSAADAVGSTAVDTVGATASPSALEAGLGKAADYAGMGGAGTPSLIEKGIGYLESHPEAARMGFGLIEGAMEGQDEKEWRDWKEKEERERYAREHQTFDPAKVRSFEDVNKAVPYRPFLQDTGRIAFSGPVLPNYRRMLDQYKKGGGNG